MDTTYETQQNSIKIRILDVPTIFDAAGEELGFSLKVMRDLEALIAQAIQNAPSDASLLELEYCAT